MKLDTKVYNAKIQDFQRNNSSQTPCLLDFFQISLTETGIFFVFCYEKNVFYCVNLVQERKYQRQNI